MKLQVFGKVFLVALLVMSLGYSGWSARIAHAFADDRTLSDLPEFAADLPAMNTGDASSLDSLLAKAGEAGSLLVLAELALPVPFIAEAPTSSPQTVLEQRAAIAAATENVLDALEGLEAQAGNAFTTIPYLSLRVDAKALQTLASLPQVASIQEDVPAAPTLASSTQLIGLPLVWASGIDGNGQTVVILDMGIDTDHPFFAGRLVDGACFSNGGGQAEQTTLCPNGGAVQYGVAAAEADSANPACWNGETGLCGHGTHVAGIAAGGDGTLDGVARGADIIAIQVYTRFNNTTDCGPSGACVLSYLSDQLRALEYVYTTLRPARSVASVNMSLGSQQYTEACDTDSRKTAIDNLRNAGIATVVAAGNDGFRNALTAPACISTAVAVGAITDTDNPPADKVLYNMHNLVDLLAPGRTISSSYVGGGYGNMNGTSTAAPHVAGAFALCKSVNPALSVNQIETILEQTGVAVLDGRSSGVHTKPRLQLDAAVAACQQVAVWTGAAGADWTDPANWSGGVAPLAGAFANIPSLPAGKRFPTISGSAELRSLLLEPNARIKVTGATVTIHGSLELMDAARITSGGSTVVLTGNQLATLTLPAGQKLNNLQVGSGSDTFRAELNSNLAVDGALLTQPGATLDLATYSLTAEGTVTNRGTLRQSRTITADVVEFLRLKNAAGDSTRYWGVDIAPSAAMGNTTVAVSGEQVCGTGSAAVRRCYDITPTTAVSSNVTFYYNASEAAGVSAPAPYHWNGVTWEGPLQGTCGSCGEALFVTGEGVSNYSPFTLRDSDSPPPLAVALANFAAQAQPGHVLLTWETTSELTNQSFTLLRSAGPDAAPEPLASVPSQGPGSAQGFSYAWHDDKVENGATYWYWIEDVDLAGVATRHGPVVVRYALRDQ